MQTYTKAEQVEQAYDVAAAENCSSDVCYSLAIATAQELGGIEIFNSNDYYNTMSFTPTRTFEFDDLSIVQVTYGDVWCLSE